MNRLLNEYQCSWAYYTIPWVEKISGKLQRILARDENDGWTCFVLKTDLGEEFKVVGHLLEAQQNIEYECSGSITTHPKFGKQFTASHISIAAPINANGIRHYLQSGMIKGIGKIQAEKIVAEFGDQSLEVLNNEPERLLDIEGIGRKTLEKIKSAWKKHAAMHDILLFMKQFNIGNADAFRIYREWGADAVKRIQMNPFSLNSLQGIGFRKADAVANALGYSQQHPLRVRAGLLFCLEKAATEGHTAQLLSNLLDAAADLLQVSPDAVSSALQHQLAGKELVLQTIEARDYVYLPYWNQAECNIATRIRELNQGSIAWNPELAEFNSELNPSPSQRQAVHSVIHSKLSIMTGGPGVGKTTVTRLILDILDNLGVQTLLCAPTGRAAKRMADSCQRESKTIHRLLEYQGQAFERNRDNPLACDFVVVDECSMLDTHVCNALLNALPNSAAVLFVGDVDQLPSVGPGHILRDFIDSNCINVVRLNEIFRQAQGSQIIVNSHRINSGRMPLPNQIEQDFFFIERTPDNIANTLIQLVSQRIPQKYGISSNAIQVLSPLRTRGDCAVMALNQRLQECLNPCGKTQQQIQYGATHFRNGDRVMQMRNNYDLEIYNGDMGTVVSIDTDDQSLCVAFEQHRVELDYEDLCDLDLAYASTIHKSQGSEYPVVVIPVTNQHHVMLTRNLLYTGITRGKKLVVLVGEKSALQTAIRRSQSSRTTTLRYRIEKIFKQNLQPA